MMASDSKLRAVLAGLWLLACWPASAADPQGYSVGQAGTGNAALDQAIRASLQLNSLRTIAPAGPFALVSRAQGDLGRVQTALRSFGYYAGHARITIDGLALDDPALPEALAALPAGTKAKIAVSAEPGPLFHLRHVTVQGEAPPDARAQLGLAEGAPAVAADVLAAQARLLTALLESGHALARVDPPAAIEFPAAHVLDVRFAVQSGPRVELGPISIAGLVDVNESYVRRRLLLHAGQPFSPSSIEKARQDLAATGVFGTVRARAAQRLDAEGHIPISLDLTERPRHAVSVSAGYSTDLGASVGATWTHRNLFGNAEQLVLSANVTQLGGNASRSLGYNVGAQLTQPDFPGRDQSLTYGARALREDLKAYSRDALIGTVTFAQKLSPAWTASIGLQPVEERVKQEEVSRSYTLLGLPVGVKYDSTDDLLAPTRGLRAALTATPTQSLGSSSATFVVLQASGSIYVNLAEPGRSVVALRGLVGSAQGASTFELPPDQRFYAGGSGTIRGFRYQAVGPRFADSNPIGGTAVDAGSVEFRQRVGENFGGAVFVDAGQIGSASAPFTGSLRIGAGVGARYYTPIGPIRLDIAVPLNRQHGDDSFELYIGLGEAF